MNASIWVGIIHIIKWLLTGDARYGHGDNVTVGGVLGRLLLVVGGFVLLCIIVIMLAEG